jgi:hypothetical protein
MDENVIKDQIKIKDGLSIKVINFLRALEPEVKLNTIDHIDGRIIIPLESLTQ